MHLFYGRTLSLELTGTAAHLVNKGISPSSSDHRILVKHWTKRVVAYHKHFRRLIPWLNNRHIALFNSPIYSLIKTPTRRQAKESRMASKISDSDESTASFSIFATISRPYLAESTPSRSLRFIMIASVTRSKSRWNKLTFRSSGHFRTLQVSIERFSRPYSTWVSLANWPRLPLVSKIYPISKSEHKALLGLAVMTPSSSTRLSLKHSSSVSKLVLRSYISMYESTIYESMFSSLWTTRVVDNSTKNIRRNLSVCSAIVRNLLYLTKRCERGSNTTNIFISMSGAS